jgi:hypothetical protein
MSELVRILATILQAFSVSTPFNIVDGLGRYEGVQSLRELSNLCSAAFAIPVQEFRIEGINLLTYFI